MSARKALSTSFEEVLLVAQESRLALSSDSVVFHKSGIEFRSARPFEPWTEMTLALDSPHDRARIHCSGVVISCTGNRHMGYHISMIFTGLNRHDQAVLSAMAANA